MKSLVQKLLCHSPNKVMKILPFLFLFITQNIIAQPLIKSIEPLSGSVGSFVTITGHGFNQTISKNIVYFGAVRAKIISGSDTLLIVKVPIGATYQPISVTSKQRIAYSSQAFIVTFDADALITQNSFATKMDFTTDNYTFSICNADIDGDGKTDIIAANYSANTISVLRNIGFPGLVYFSKVDFPTLNNPGSVVAGDINGDGKLDIVVANDASSTVSVYKNTSTPGNVSFAPHQDYQTGNYAVSVAVSDLNGDGKADLIVTNNQYSSVSVYKNTSAGEVISFDAKIDFTTGSAPSGIAINDYNGDNKPDLAIANQFSNSISILANISIDGIISFAGKTDVSVGTQPYNLSAGDLDGDGRADIAVANLFSNSVSVLRNASKRNVILFEEKIDYSMPSNTETVSIGDLNGDGKPDLAVAGSDINVNVLQNKSKKGSITFTDIVPFYLGGSSSFIISGDEDGDGKPDIIVSNFNKVSVLRNIMGPTAFTSQQSLMIQNPINLNMRIFPNPASEYVIVGHPLAKKDAVILVYNMQGQQVKVIKIDKNSSQTQLTVMDLSAGNYSIVWSDGTKNANKILVIK